MIRFRVQIKIDDDNDEPVCIRAKWPIRKRLSQFLYHKATGKISSLRPPLHFLRQGCYSIACTHLYTWAERDTVRERFPTQENMYTTQSSVVTRTRTARFEVGRANQRSQRLLISYRAISLIHFLV